MATTVRAARLLDLGTQPYRDVWEMQHQLHAAVRDRREPDTWIVVEHPPVITLGRQAVRTNVLLSDTELAARRVEVIPVERGGDVTYHGPGQLVVYPIRRLERFREVVPLVRSLEGAVIDACARFGVNAQRWSEHAGVWVETRQICAIGLAVRQMVSLHGIALNVSTPLDYDRLIAPCGLSGRGITSLSKETGRSVRMEEAKDALLAALARTFEVTWQSKSI
ncbi:MAG: lipoyl(octanoyl) transferase LipB [Candidatus Tumulicola sp.]